MMTSLDYKKTSDYVNSVIGKPYVVGENGPNEFDCWGLIIHSFRELDGTELPNVFDRLNFELSFADGIKDYQPCGREEGAVFFAYTDGLLTHCGRVLCGMAIHAVGNRQKAQDVQAWKLRALEKVYDTVEYYQYVAD